MKNCADLQLEIDKKCIKNNVVIVQYVRKSIIYFVKQEDTGKRGEKNPSAIRAGKTGSHKNPGKWMANGFLLPSILIGDSELRPLTVNLFMFRSATSTQWNLFIAGLTLCIIPTIILYICAQKYITSGLTMGAVK